MRELILDMWIRNSGDWIFQGDPIIQEDILNYFKANLGYDPEGGYYIINRFGELAEKAWVRRVDAPPLKAMHLEARRENLPEVLTRQTPLWDLDLDSGQSVPLAAEQVILWQVEPTKKGGGMSSGEEQLLALREGVPCQLNAAVQLRLSDYVRETKAGWEWDISVIEKRFGASCDPAWAADPALILHPILFHQPEWEKYRENRLS